MSQIDENLFFKVTLTYLVSLETVVGYLMLRSF